MPFQVSPGVNITETDLTTVVPNVATSIGAIAGSFQWGPVMERTIITRETELVKIANACKKKRYKLFVSNNIKLALKVRADGIYIPSFNKTKQFSNLEKKNFIILGSAHNQKEIREKISQKCRSIFLSPIFFVAKSKNFLDVYKFNFLSQLNKVDLLALGGINEHNIRKLKLLHIKGFGGIRAFKKKPAYKRPVF